MSRSPTGLNRTAGSLAGVSTAPSVAQVHDRALGEPGPVPYGPTRRHLGPSPLPDWNCPAGRPEGHSQVRSGGGRRVATALARSACPAREEAGDLVGGMSLEGVRADVVAGQGGLRAGVAQQALDVAQRNAMVEPDGPDGAAQRVRPDRPADPGDLGGAGD